MSDDTFQAKLYDTHGRLVSNTWVSIPSDARVLRIDSHAVWRADDGEPRRVSAYRLMLWHDVEQIAAYVRGDGTDAQRQALADGILEGRHVGATPVEQPKPVDPMERLALLRHQIERMGMMQTPSDSVERERAQHQLRVAQAEYFRLRNEIDRL